MRLRLVHIVLAALVTLFYLGERLAPCVDMCSAEDTAAALHANVDAANAHANQTGSDCDDHHSPDGDHHCDHCICPCHVPIVLSHQIVAITPPNAFATHSTRQFKLPQSAAVDTRDPVPLV